MNPVPTEHDPRPYAIALRVLAGVVLVVAMLGADGYAMEAGGAEMVAAAQEPTDAPEDDQPTEQPPPEDAPAPDDEEPASEPGDVPLAVWIGAILFLAVAVGLAVWQTTNNSSSASASHSG
jgi:hypothetical protein